MQRRLVAWRAGGESINSLILQGGELQRARARQLVRTNPYAANAAASFTTHAVGCGINLSSLVEASALKDEIQRLWLAWTHEADADDLTDVYDTSSRPPTRSACRATPSRRWTSSRALGMLHVQSNPLPKRHLGARSRCASKARATSSIKSAKKSFRPGSVRSARVRSRAS
jgi:Phage portal protein, lambda family